MWLVNKCRLDFIYLFINKTEYSTKGLKHGKFCRVTPEMGHLESSVVCGHIR